MDKRVILGFLGKFLPGSGSGVLNQDFVDKIFENDLRGMRH